MTKKKNYLVSQSNEFTESRKDWPIMVARAYCCIIETFNKRVDMYISAQEKFEPDCLSLFDNVSLKDVLRYNIKRHQLAVEGTDGKINIPSKSEFKKAFEFLSDNKIIIGKVDDEEHWKKIPLIGTVEYRPDIDCMIVNQDMGTIEFLLGLKNKYTAFNPAMAMKFKSSQYSFPFYTWCCQWRDTGEFKLSVREIKHRLMLNEYTDDYGTLHKEAYMKPRDFRREVIDKAKNEIKALFDAGDCDVCFDYEEIKDETRPGRKRTIGFAFSVISKKKRVVQEKKELPSYLIPQYNKRLVELRSVLIPFFSRSLDKNWPVHAINELGKQVQKDMKLLDKVERYVSNTINDFHNGKIKSVAAAVRGWFRKNLGII